MALGLISGCGTVRKQRSTAVGTLGTNNLNKAVIGWLQTWCRRIVGIQHKQTCKSAC